MREHSGPGWRMYYAKREDMLIVMLGGEIGPSKWIILPRAIRIAELSEG